MEIFDEQKPEKAFVIVIFLPSTNGKAFWTKFSTGGDLLEVLE